MSTDKATEARKGLLGSVAGKAKEIAGAVSGNDDLVAEGQLQLAEVRNRKEAAADEAVAEAQSDEAVQRIRESTREASQRATSARVEAEREESVVTDQRRSEHAAAAREAEAQAEAGRREAEQQADDLAESRLREADAIDADATSTEKRAAAERLRLVREADAIDHQAAQLRAETEK
jgi:uncharacterized protein YjbJ (UPF0337 family)